MGEGDTWSAKEVFADLKQDLMGRFDKADDVLRAINHRLDTTATKDDVHEIHRRIDGIEANFGGRIGTLEAKEREDRAATAALASSRNRVSDRRRFWITTVLAAVSVMALIAAVAVPLFG